MLPAGRKPEKFIARLMRKLNKGSHTYVLDAGNQVRCTLCICNTAGVMLS
jgi:hypothetical protein